MLDQQHPALKKIQHDARRTEYLFLLLLLLLAALLRLAALGDIPPGPGYDELQDARLSEHILDGNWSLYFSENFGQEPLYPTLTALTVQVLGWSVVSLRLSGALLGVLTVLALYLAARQLTNRHTALVAAALQTISFWPLIETRMGLETTLLPPMSALAILFLARGLRDISQRRGARWLMFGLSGLFIGGQVYAYTPGRVMPLLVPALLVYLLLFDRSRLKRHWPGLLILVLVTLLVVAPLALFLRSHPEAEQRLDQLSGPLDALRQGNIGPILNLMLGTLGMFTLQGEPQWLYNIQNRPLLDPFTSLFFYVGLALCLIRGRGWRYGLILLWLTIGLTPAFVSPPPASFTHTLIAQPAVYLILGLGVTFIVERLARWRRWAAPLALISLLALNALLSWSAYFIVWASAVPVQELYQGSITAVAYELDAQDSSGPVAIGAPYVNYWHPWNAMGFELASQRQDLNVRWFNPEGAWVWPAGAGATTFYFPTDPLGPQDFDPGLRQLFMADATPVAQQNRSFTAYRVGQPAALERRLESARDVPITWPPDLPGRPSPTLPLVFDNRFALLGADLELDQATALPGDTVRLVTFWEVLAPNGSPVVAFAHLTSNGTDIWGQHDWLDVRPAGLLAGDRFAQIHLVPVKPETPSGSYFLQLGLYNPDTLVRLPILLDDRPMADRIAITELEVTQSK